MPTITISPSPATAGLPILVTYTGGTPGDMVTVELDNGSSQSTLLHIQLGESGEGTAAWEVPETGWPLINATSPGCLEVTAAVIPGAF